MSSEFEFEEPDVEGLIASAEAKKGSGSKSKAKPKAKAKAASKPAKGKATPKRKPRSKAKSAPEPATAGSGSGLITRGVRAAFGGVEVARSVGPWSLGVVVAATAVIALSAASWVRAPAGLALDGIRFQGVQVPTLLQEQWLRGFHRFGEMRTKPDREVLDAFATHLAQQPSVGGVDAVELVWVENGPDQAPSRQVSVSLRLRKPVLPVQLAGGRRAWVDRDGVVLSPLLSGPKGEPLVRGYEDGGPEAMRELLAVWPQLRERLPPGLVSAVYLDHPLGTGDQRGLVFMTKPGAQLIWGRPGEDRFGLTRERKIRNLVHTISCQGDLSKVDAINVRFGEPFAQDS